MRTRQPEKRSTLRAQQPKRSPLTRLVPCCHPPSHRTRKPNQPTSVRSFISGAYRTSVRQGVLLESRNQPGNTRVRHRGRRAERPTEPKSLGITCYAIESRAAISSCPAIQPTYKQSYTHGMSPSLGGGSVYPGGGGPSDKINRPSRVPFSH